MLMITRGGIIPGGLLAEAMNVTHLLTAAVAFALGVSVGGFAVDQQHQEGAIGAGEAVAGEIHRDHQVVPGQVVDSRTTSWPGRRCGAIADAVALLESHGYRITPPA